MNLLPHNTKGKSNQESKSVPGGQFGLCNFINAAHMGMKEYLGQAGISRADSKNIKLYIITSKFPNCLVS